MRSNSIRSCGGIERAESEALAVVDSVETRKVIGLLTEGYALRRYAEELDKARVSLTGSA